MEFLKDTQYAVKEEECERSLTFRLEPNDASVYPVDVLSVYPTTTWLLASALHMCQ